MSVAGRLFIGALIVTTGACAKAATEPLTSEGGLKVTVGASHLTLSNESGQTIRYVITDRDFVRALVCLCPGSPTLESGGQVTVPFSAITGYDAARTRTVGVHWGVATTSEEAIDPARIKLLTVTL